MVTKDRLYSYRTALKSMEISGNNTFKHMKAGAILFKAETDKFLNEYNIFFPNECRILKTYALKIIKNNSFTTDELSLLQYLVNIIDEDFEKTIKRPKKLSAIAKKILM